MTDATLQPPLPPVPSAPTTLFPLVLRFPKELMMTDSELLGFCLANKGLRIERTKTGEIIIDMPTGSETGDENSELNFQLRGWNKQQKRGIVFDSSSGFTLPNGAMRAPDAAWVSLDRWNRLTETQREGFAPICPDFLIELMSPSDTLNTLKEKMEEWMENGCKLAWLLNPQTETVFVYRQGKPPEEINGFDKKLSGEEVLPDFVLDLNELR